MDAASLGTVIGVGLALPIFVVVHLRGRTDAGAATGLVGALRDRLVHFKRLAVLVGLTVPTAAVQYAVFFDPDSVPATFLTLSYTLFAILLLALVPTVADLARPTGQAVARTKSPLRTTCNLLLVAGYGAVLVIVLGVVSKWMDPAGAQAMNGSAKITEFAVHGDPGVGPRGNAG